MKDNPGSHLSGEADGAAKAGEKPLSAPRQWRGAIKTLLLALTALYTVGLIGSLIVLEWWGESHWLLSVAIFAPPPLFLTPLLILAPGSFLFHRRLLVCHLLCVVVVLFGFMTFRWRTLPTSQMPPLVVVTNNVGQGTPAQLHRFIVQENPDAVLLQDAVGRGSGYAKSFPSYEVASHGEFILLSRHLIQSSGILKEPRYHGRPVAARFEIVVRGQPLILYNVHLPTPRRQLNYFLSGRVASDWMRAGEEDSLGGGYGAWLEERSELVRGLAKVLENESEPFLVGGDFNLPDHGRLYHHLADRMTDAFAASGRGWGLSFPGRSSQAITLFGPWLRIDYLFAGRGWAPVSCAVDCGRSGQHRPVVARFTPMVQPLSWIQ